MDSSIADRQQQPPQPERCQPQRPLQQSHPEETSYYYYHSSQSAAGSDCQNHSNHISSQGYGAAYQPPHLASGPITVPSEVSEQSPAYDVPPELNPAAATVAPLSESSEFAGSMAWQESVRDGVTGTGVVPLHYPHPQNGRSLPRRRHDRGRRRGGRLGRGRGIESSNPTPASETELLSAKTPTTGPALSQKPVPQIFWCEICRVDCYTLDTLEQHKNGKRHKKTMKKLEEMQAWLNLQRENEARDTENDIVRQQSQSQAEPLTDNEIIIPADGKKENVQDGQENLQEALIAAVEEEKKVQNGQENLQDATARAVEEEKNVEDGHQKVQEAKAINGNDLVRLQQSQNTDLQCGGIEEKLTSEQPTNASSFPSNNGHGGRNSSKRKITGFGRGDKRARHLEPMGKKPSKGSREQPVVCTICHITCDTQAVFETHLVGRKHTSRAEKFHGQQPVVCMICHITCDTQAVFETHLVGKKHTSRAKKFHGQQATSGPLGYFHDNPEYVHTSQGLPPIFYGLQPPEVFHPYADMQDAPLEFHTGEVQCEQAVEAAVAKVAESVPEGLKVVSDTDVEKVKSAKENHFVPDNDDGYIKPDSALSGSPTEGSLASKS